MRIGVTGTHGTGKTTACYELAAELKKMLPNRSVGVLNEVARYVRPDGSERTQLLIFATQLVAELQSPYDVTVCDRTVLDNLAYALEYGHTWIVRTLLQFATVWLRTYDVIWFKRDTNFLHSDGVRCSDPTFQRNIDVTLAHWLANEPNVVHTREELFSRLFECKQ